jgi:hypothetical protein
LVTAKLGLHSRAGRKALNWSLTGRQSRQGGAGWRSGLLAQLCTRCNGPRWLLPADLILWLRQSWRQGRKMEELGLDATPVGETWPTWPSNTRASATSQGDWGACTHSTIKVRRRRCRARTRHEVTMAAAASPHATWGGSRVARGQRLTAADHCQAKTDPASPAWQRS